MGKSNSIAINNNFLGYATLLGTNTKGEIIDVFADKLPQDVPEIEQLMEEYDITKTIDIQGVLIIDFNSSTGKLLRTDQNEQFKQGTLYFNLGFNLENKELFSWKVKQYKDLCQSHLEFEEENIGQPDAMLIGYVIVNLNDGIITVKLFSDDTEEADEEYKQLKDYSWQSCPIMKL